MLTAETIFIRDLTEERKEQMFALMQSYYENVNIDNFTSDLERKDLIILLKKEEVLCGFSTQLLSRCTFSGHTVKFLFSGDTIIAKEHRNSLALPLAWGKRMLAEIRDEPEIPLYWLLTTKGYKTYRYLSVFFKEFFPSPEKEISDFEQTAMETFTSLICKESLDRAKWIIKASPQSQKLRKGVADITESRLKNRDIAFFEELNPGHADGDELVCLALFSEENLTPFILRKLKTL